MDAQERYLKGQATVLARHLLSLPVIQRQARCSYFLLDRVRCQKNVANLYHYQIHVPLPSTAAGPS